MSDDDKGYIRKNDELINSIMRDVTNLEESVRILTLRQDSVLTNIEAEREDHFQIRSRVELVKNKLDKIEDAVNELREARDDRDRKVTELALAMSSLRTIITEIHGTLTDLTSGAHAAVHRWAEGEMEHRTKQRELRNKIYEALLTKLATGAVMLFAALLALGIYAYFEGEVNKVIQNNPPANSTQGQP